MEISYYSADASCAPDAKLNKPESDDFEIGWSDACSVVEGDGEHTIQNQRFQPNALRLTFSAT